MQAVWAVEAKAAFEVETAVEARMAVKVGAGEGVAVAVEADGLP